MCLLLSYVLQRNMYNTTNMFNTTHKLTVTVAVIIDYNIG